MPRPSPADVLSTTLEPHLGWFEAWCRRATARSGVDWREPFQSGVVYLLTQLERGVLDSVEAAGWRPFVANTLMLGARQRLKTEFAQKRRLPSAAEAAGAREEQAPPESVPLEVLLRRARGTEVRAALRQLSSPVRRFVLVAVYVPDALDLPLLEEAAAFRRGGSRLFVRPVAQAWPLLRAQRRRLDGAEWKAWVARVVAFTGPPGRVPAAPLAKVLWRIDQHLTRGREELLSVLGNGPP
ncbi:MAG: hypothetical protein RL653_3215 [Pseudomonadota bacterium]|jgi:hypothetical protein